MEAPNADVTPSAAARLLLAMNFLLLPLIRVIPGLPVHDGVRLIIAAFPFLGILAGIGLAKCFERGQLWGRAAVGAILLSALADAVLFFPQGLSFYNILIGGVDGANRFGMEAAYYWDGLDREVTDWLNANTGENEAVLFSAASPGVLRRLGEWGVLRPKAESISSFRGRRDKSTPMPKFRWYVLQNRGGGLTKPDKYLLEKKKPVRTKNVGTGRYAPPLSGETPIILIYRYRDFLEACRSN